MFSLQFPSQPTMVRIQVPLCQGIFSVMVMNSHSAIVLSLSMILRDANKLLVYSVKVCCLKPHSSTDSDSHLFSYCTIAPCLSNSITDCTDCNNAINCPLIPSDLCYCNSECYRNGMCCSDVGYLQNCLGKACTGFVTYVYFCRVM